MSYTLSVLYFTVNGRNMSVISEKRLCCFYTYERKPKRSLLEFSSTYSNVK